MNSIVEEIEKVTTPLLNQEKIELVDLTYQKTHAGWTLCFYLDKEGGITLDDCEKWSGKLGEIIDQSNLIDRAYNLEVSSPGIERPIKKLSDFLKYNGQRVHVKLYSPLNGQKNFHGFLKGASEEIIQLKLEEGNDVELPRSQIAKVNLDPIF